MFSAVASGIFAVRNADKTRHGDYERGAVTLGQTAGLVQEIAKYDNLAANACKSTISVFSDLAKEHKAFEYAGKVTKFAVDHVNPLICASGVIKTAKSNDKIKTGITEAGALTLMFAGEGIIKQNYDKVANSKALKNFGQKIKNDKLFKPIYEYITKHKLGGKIGMIVKGAVFVGGSMGSYAIGENLGSKYADHIKANINQAKKNKINQMT